MAKIIAFAGKGGVGKTTICSAFVRILGEHHPEAKILAIDADPAVGLSTALGVKVDKTLDDIRREIIEKAASGANKEAVELLGEVRFRIFDALIEKDNFAFLAIGRPEGAGCYCAINAYLKEVIDMVSRDFDYVIIDGEAGIEQINRRVMEKVTHLFLVSDASKKGIGVVESIKNVADELVMYEQCNLIINRVEDESLVKDAVSSDLNVIAYVPVDSMHARNDILGKSIYELPVVAPVYVEIDRVINKMGLD